MVMGEGRNPGVEHLLKLGEAAKITKPRISQIIEQTKAALGLWPVLAKEYGVSAAKNRLVTDFMKSHAVLSRIDGRDHSIAFDQT